MSVAPIPFMWDGESFSPIGRYAKEADKHFVVGMVYRMVEHQERSKISHDHFFASVEEAWQNLPEGQAERFPSPEHLRKYALIRSGFGDSRQIVASSKAEALRIAAFIQPFDEYAIVTVKEAIVTVWTAQSQSQRAMGKQVFQKSKEAVLFLLSEMIGTDVTTLSQNAGRAA